MEQEKAAGIDNIDSSTIFDTYDKNKDILFLVLRHLLDKIFVLIF